MALLDELRKKTVQERKFVASVTAGVIAFIVFIIWASVFMNQLSSGNLIEEQEEETEVQESSGGIFDRMKAMLQDARESNPFTNFGDPVEYRREDGSTTTLESDIDLEEVMRVFEEFQNREATSTSSSSPSN